MSSDPAGACTLHARGLKNRIGFFLHIPLPPPDILTAMPNHDRLIPALMDYDLVGFQTENDASNFARYLANEMRLPSHISHGPAGEDRRMRIGVFPVGIETEEFHRRARRAERSSFVREVVDSVPGEVIIGVDRLDYSKGLSHRLDAFETFLAANPDWRRRVTYIQITPKSRSEIGEYADAEQAVVNAAGRINSTYGDVSWTPVRYVNRAYQPDRAGRALSLIAVSALVDAAARWDESCRKGICGSAGRRESRRADPLELCRRGGGNAFGGSRRKSRSRSGGGRDPEGTDHAARRTAQASRGIVGGAARQ